MLPFGIVACTFLPTTFLEIACKKLYSLRILRRAGVDQGSMLKVYISSVLAVPDPDFEIRGARSSRPLDKVGAPVSKKTFFRPFVPQFGLKISRVWAEISF